MPPKNTPLTGTPESAAPPIVPAPEVNKDARVLTAALEAAANGVVITDREGVIEWVNPAFSTLTGYSASEVIGQNPRVLKSGLQPESYYADLWQTIAAGRVWHGEITNRRKDGTLYWEEMTITPVRDASGAIAHFVAIKQDVTARRDAEDKLIESEDRFRQLVEKSNELFVMAREDGTIVYASPNFPAITGWAPADLLGTSVGTRLHPADREAALRCLALSSSSTEIRYRFKDGTWHWLAASGRKITLRNGEAAFVVVSRDVTARKFAELKLRTDDERHRRQRAALIAFAARHPGQLDDLDAAIRQLTEISAKTLGVARVSVWRYSPDRSAIRCADLYELTADRHTAGTELFAATYPRYFGALQQAEVIAADEACKHGWTAEFCASYLEPLGITSMLDAPIHFNGGTEGVLCHEHIGPARKWHPDEQNFAVALANQVSLALEAAERRRVEAELRESESRTRAITDSAQDAIIMMDPAGAVSYWNPAAERILGFTRTEALGRDLHALIAPERHHRAGPSGFLRTAEGAACGKLLDLEARRKDGREIPIQLSLSAVQLGGAWHSVGIIRDITARKQAEAAVIAARDAAVESARLKAEFLANMSHEIRTPMNGVLGMLNLLADTPLADQQRDFAETARASAEALLTVLNDILDFSKIEAGKLTMEETPFDLRELLESTLELLAERGQAKGLELMTEVVTGSPTMLRGDPTRLRQVLLNLVGNAIKFTDAGEVVIRARAEPVDGDGLRVRFEVRDTGIGIPPEVQARLFQAFVQADGSTTRKYGGTGLGLAISRRIVELMGGEIGVDSVAGRGSTFWFSVPLRRGEELPVPVRRGSLAGQPVLIVDDNATNRAVLHHQLAAVHAVDRTAVDGPSALRLLREAAAAGRPYPLVLLDFQMPGMDGLEVARAIQADPAIAGARVVMLTSLGAHLDAPTRRAAGIAECLFKPVRHARLLDSLERHLATSPLAAPTPAAPAPTTLPAGPGLRILVAEDNLVNQRVALGLLQKLGYPADVVGNGRAAVEAQARAPYDVILMDCQMPEMEGYEATRSIRRAEAACLPPRRPVHIIAMTAHALEGDRDRCLAAGMDDYLSKPVKVSDLGAALARAGAGPTGSPTP